MTDASLAPLVPAPLVPAPAVVPARNAPCPCGSAKKWKKCCGAAAKFNADVIAEKKRRAEEAAKKAAYDATPRGRREKQTRMLTVTALLGIAAGGVR